MILLFEDKEKKFKTSFLKSLENHLKVLKNLYDEVYINSEGLAYSVDSKITTNGRVFCKTKLHELFDINKDDLLKLNLKALTDCFKIGKSKIIGFSLEEILVIKTTEMDFEVGVVERSQYLNIDYINDIINEVSYSCNLNEYIEPFINKEFINIRKGDFDLLLTHKLFPMINKSVNFDFSAKVNDNGSFYGIFRNVIEERNKKDEITFDIVITYIYRFLDLN